MSKQRHKHADLIIAWANGAEIEYFSKIFNEWGSCANPLWFNEDAYRIKPKKVEKWKWVLQNDDSELYISCEFYSIEESVKFQHDLVFIQKIDSTKITVEE